MPSDMAMPGDMGIAGETGRSRGGRPGDGRTEAGLAEFLPAALRRELSSDQVTEIERAARDWSRGRGRDLPVDIRLSLPLPFRGIFVNVLAGSERRSRSRLADERRRRPLGRLGNIVFTVCLVAVLNCSLLLGALALSGIVE